MNRNIIKKKMALSSIARQDILICIVSRHFNNFFLSINFSPLMGSLHHWSIAGLLHGASPDTPVAPRILPHLINRYWTGWAAGSPGGRIGRIFDDCWRAKPADMNRGRQTFFFFSPEVYSSRTNTHVQKYIQRHAHRELKIALFFLKKQNSPVTFQESTQLSSI